MGKHTFWMIIGCTVPLLLIFLLPLFGIRGNYTFLIFIVAMFACHLLMPMHHGGHEHKGHMNIPKTLKQITINHINIRKFGLAFGTAGSIIIFWLRIGDAHFRA